MLPGKRTELSGQSERQHEVIAGNQLLRLLVYPALRFVRLAVRAVAMATGVRQIALFGAVVAGKFHPGAGKGGKTRYLPLHPAASGLI